MLEVGSLKLPHGPVVTLRLEAGQLHTLSGPNGSGKSLLLKSLALLTRSEWSVLKLNGNDVGTLSPTDWRRRVLYVPPIPLDTAGTVAHYALLPWTLGARQGLSAELSSFDELHRLGLWERDIDKLSSGEKQFIQLTRALALKPEVLLLDESLGQMDSARVARAERMLGKFCAQGGSAVLVTHDTHQLERLTGPRLDMAQLTRA